MKHLYLHHIVASTLFFTFAAFPATSQAGSYKFCGEYIYHFDDNDFSDDYLKHEAGRSTGRIDAAYSFMWVYKDGLEPEDLVFYNWMDGDGCTTTVLGEAGTYHVYLVPSINRAAEGKRIDVFKTSEDDDKTNWWDWDWTYWNETITLPNTNSDEVITIDTGTQQRRVSGAAAVATHVMKLTETKGNMLPDEYYRIYAKEPGCEGESQSLGRYIYLCEDGNGKWASRNKYIIAHEIGHSVMEFLMGTPDVNYDADITDPDIVPLCQCTPFVQTNNDDHCAQSREKISTAQVEGWGYFYAADIFNDPNHAYAVLAHPKEFMDVDGTVYDPPVILPLGEFTFFGWTRTHCPRAERGSEWDWANFFWLLNNRGGWKKFNHAKIRDVYMTACADDPDQPEACNDWNDPDHVTCDSLVDAVSHIYGENSARAEFWRYVGNYAGVNL